jgi:hypothetical protein
LKNAGTIPSSRQQANSKWIFPQYWENLNIKMHTKKNGKKIKANEFRPISLISNLGKLLERCVDKHL